MEPDLYHRSFRPGDIAGPEPRSCGHVEWRAVRLPDDDRLGRRQAILDALWYRNQPDQKYQRETLTLAHVLTIHKLAKRLGGHRFGADLFGEGLRVAFELSCKNPLLERSADEVTQLDKLIYAAAKHAMIKHRDALRERQPKVKLLGRHRGFVMRIAAKLRHGFEPDEQTPDQVTVETEEDDPLPVESVALSAVDSQLWQWKWEGDLSETDMGARLRPQLSRDQVHRRLDAIWRAILDANGKPYQPMSTRKRRSTKPTEYGPPLPPPKKRAGPVDWTRCHAGELLRADELAIFGVRDVPPVADLPVTRWRLADVLARRANLRQAA